MGPFVDVSSTKTIVGLRSGVKLGIDGSAPKRREDGQGRAQDEVREDGGHIEQGALFEC